MATQDVCIGEWNMCRLNHHNRERVRAFWLTVQERGVKLESCGCGDGGYIVVLVNGKEIGREFYGYNPVPLWITLGKMIGIEPPYIT